MRLSILDQSPITYGQTPQQALQSSLALAQLGEALGYTRYWIAEHHGMDGLASSVPEVMLSYIGANTSQIRIGAGAVLLPHYKPYKVAEIYNMLATLFPERIDVGIGRAPGGSAEASIALSGNFLENVKKYPDLIEELLHFIHHNFPKDHFYSKTKAAPIPTEAPSAWILGTSEKSTKLASKNGLGYVFGHFMSDEESSTITQTYVDDFVPSNSFDKPYVIVTVSVICTETNQTAEKLARYHEYWKLRGQNNKPLPSLNELKKMDYTTEEKQEISKIREKMVVGDPKLVSEKLNEIKRNYRADEMMIVTITHNDEYRRQSYQLIADEMLAN
ncbi:LLM class flavin-dependent oxidoreductase [Aquibacillus sediminis]|uniref:LLM class flavin-dependent oxidoreductase n=1 Tax=Aquibacillus sediminis TaxID=2574734 RepID=UPI001109DE09|nr:LLM class flavin-dependent oxidoreductase [Aquibacillus sediminis]